MNTPIRQQLGDAMNQIEALADEIRVQLDLAGKDARDTWEQKLEPKLFEAREHARAAQRASKTAIEETLEAFQKFKKSL